MLTQWPTPHPKCKLIISSFLVFPYLLDCLIYTRNAIFIVLLLDMMGGGGDMIGGVWLIYIRVWGGIGGGHHLIGFVLFFLFFYILLSHILSPFI